jgi:hypothetical protein
MVGHTPLIKFFNYFHGTFIFLLIYIFPIQYQKSIFVICDNGALTGALAL